MRLRNTGNGAIVNVDDDLANTLLGGTWKHADEVSFPEGSPDDSWKVSELVAYTKANGIEISGDARKKADVLTSIAAASGQGSGGSGNAHS